MSALRDLQDYMKPASEHIRQTNDNLAEAIATCWQVTDDFGEFQEMSAIDALPFISEVSEEDPEVYERAVKLADDTHEREDGWEFWTIELFKDIFRTYLIARVKCRWRNEEEAA